MVLVPGVGGMAWYWHRVAPLIRAAGHEVIAIDLPSDDRRAGLAVYADIVIRAIAERNDAILVAQSLAGFTAPLVCARASVRLLAFVNAMIPKAGDTAGAWGYKRSRRSEGKSCEVPLLCDGIRCGDILPARRAA
ncbi:alpha/beta fold hydrolase [Bradyrhizobium sp. AZCC 1699]|uniref:alpha/beta fold hydrolase n=1 Tax=unclassified Bradyrhizobium TaxID=2631580 RepID=UPI003FA56C3F